MGLPESGNSSLSSVAIAVAARFYRCCERLFPADAATAVDDAERWARRRKLFAQKGRIERGSGYPALDQDTGQMVDRASPFPPSMTQQSASFLVPIEFTLR
jgi:hypothetical protein